MPPTNPSRWGDPEALKLLSEAERALIEERSKKIESFAQELGEYITHVGQAKKMSLADVSIALMQETARAIVAASLVTADPEAFIERSSKFFTEQLVRRHKELINHPLAQIIARLWRDQQCSKESSSEAPPSSSSSTSAESAPSSSSESKDG